MFEVRWQKSKDKVTLWRDWTKEERMANGEILDVRYLLGRTYMLMAHDLSTGQFYKDVEDMGPEFVREQRDEDTDPSKFSLMGIARGEVQWVKVPNIKIGKSSAKKWGALAGKSVRAEIWKDLNELDRMQKRTWWDKVMNQFKLNKTARHPGVHMNNIMSNLMFMDMADVRLTDLVDAVRIFSEVYGKGQDNAHYKDARDHGAFGGGYLDNEIVNSALKPILEEIKGLQTKPTHEAVAEWVKAKYGSDSMAATAGFLASFSTKALNGIGKFDRKAQQLYGMEDELFRMATYLRKLEDGYSPEDAARYARDQFLNYDIRAPWINSARRTFLPFLAYTYRAIPVMFQAAAERPWKLAKYFTLAYGFQAMAYAMAGGDPDEEEKGIRDDMQGGCLGYRTETSSPPLERRGRHEGRP